ncbi:MAG: hypothetical protein RLZZ116_1735 [Planctomycetota bacterium]|jgi:hypothetical protein
MQSLIRSLLALTVVALSSCGGSEPAPAPAPAPAAQPAAAPAPAPATAAPRTASGAALEYPAVVAKFTDALCGDALQLIFNTKGVSLNGSRAKGTWSALSRSLEQSQPQIEALLRVAETKDCTFAEVIIEQGARRLPPELTELFRGVRNGSAMLSADAARNFVAGDTAAAARRAAAIASMLRHIAGSGLPKSSDFATDLLDRLKLVVPPMAAGVNGMKLPDADRATLLAALNALNAADPCGTAGGSALNDDFAAKQAAALQALKAALGG